MFPKILTGICPVCGGKGDYDDSPGDGFAAPFSTGDYADKLLIGTSEEPAYLSVGSPGAVAFGGITGLDVIGSRMAASVNGIANTLRLYGEIYTGDVEEFTIKGAVYRVGDMRVIADGPAVSYDITSGSFGWYTAPLTRPVRLVAGEEYVVALIIGTWTGDLNDPALSCVPITNADAKTYTTVIPAAAGKGFPSGPSVWSVGAGVQYPIYVSSAFMPDYAQDESNHGYDLVDYRGDKMCKMCKKRLIQQDEQRPMTEYGREQDEFRHKAGYKDEIT